MACAAHTDSRDGSSGEGGTSVNDRSFLRLGAGAAIAGGLLALAGNVLHPRFANVDDVTRFRRIADSNLVVAANLLLIAALVLVIAGFIAIAASLEDRRGGGLARF